jgi:hypothetical protein
MNMFWLAPEVMVDTEEERNRIISGLMDSACEKIEEHLLRMALLKQQPVRFDNDECPVSIKSSVILKHPTIDDMGGYPLRFSINSTDKTVSHVIQVFPFENIKKDGVLESGLNPEYDKLGLIQFSQRLKSRGSHEFQEKRDLSARSLSVNLYGFNPASFECEFFLR